jgi:hypothetical protein
MSSTTTLPTFKLPHDPLTPLDPNEAPTPAAIHNLLAEVYSNAMAIQTKLGGGQHGHLGLVMPAAHYILLPGAVPYDLQRPDIPDYAKMTAAERDQWKDLYNDESRQYMEAHAIALQLKTMLIQAVPLIYISHLQHHLLKLATVSIQEILHLLEDNEGTITSDDLCSNQEKLQAPWDPSTPSSLMAPPAGNLHRPGANSSPTPCTCALPTPSVSKQWRVSQSGHRLERQTGSRQNHPQFYVTLH